MSSRNRHSSPGQWRGPAAGLADLRAVQRLGSTELDVARRLVARLLAREGTTLRWASLARLAPAGLDSLDVEEVVAVLRCAGLVQVKVRDNPRGDPEPYMLRLSPGQGQHARQAVDLEASTGPGAAHAERGRLLVEALRRLMEVEDTLPVPGRALVQLALGDSKRVRVADYRAEIEAAFELPMEQLVRDHCAAVLTAGKIRYRFNGLSMDARASSPWLAVTEPVIEGLSHLEVGAVEVITVENLTPFEALALRGNAHNDAVLVYTAGFLGRAERAWCRRLARHDAVRRFRHWGDLDAGGLYIYRDLERLLAQAAPDKELSPWRMEPELLDHELAVPLTDRDRARLIAYLKEPSSPLRPLARAMLHRDLKLEQEALLLSPPGDRSRARPQ